MQQTLMVSNDIIVITKDFFVNDGFSVLSLSIAWVELEDIYELSAVNTLQEAVNTILKFLGLAPANLSEKVSEGVHTHTLLCSGELRQITK